MKDKIDVLIMTGLILGIFSLFICDIYLVAIMLKAVCF